ncbi:hypothetical protein BVRB_6g147990 [Beta vulgaris subsp. vulgaris]|nr:hypothetical protein BVRB_6g147990 [Beta vulgaris subsp. vulgaris]
MCLCPPTAASPTARGAGGDTNRLDFGWLPFLTSHFIR